MVELETKVVPTVSNYIVNWKRFVDDTIGYVKTNKVEFVLEKWNSFHKNIQFMYELERENKLSFLDFLLNRGGNNTETTVYRKSTNSNIYQNWNSFTHDTWKRGSLRTLIKRTYLIFSNKKYLEEELNHINFISKIVRMFLNG